MRRGPWSQTMPSMSATSTYRADAVLAAEPCAVMALLTSPDAIGRWTPVPFEVEGVDERLHTGDLARVTGTLAGRRVAFEVEVAEAGHDRLALTARGPVNLDVEYRIEPTPAGSAVEARVDVRRGRGVVGGLLAGATGALLSGGALRVALDRMAAAA